MTHVVAYIATRLTVLYMAHTVPYIMNRLLAFYIPHIVAYIIATTQHTQTHRRLHYDQFKMISIWLIQLLILSSK
jgi:hypothetical protein